MKSSLNPKAMKLPFLSEQRGRLKRVVARSALGGTVPSSYSKRGWTYPQKNTRHLEKEFGDKMKATLVHLDTRHKVAPDGNKVG